MTRHELNAKLKYARNELEKDAALAKFQLDDDMLLFEGSVEKNFTLDQMQRDILLSHTRQDAAHALITAIRLYHEMQTLKVMLGILMAIAVGILWMVWK